MKKVARSFPPGFFKRLELDRDCMKASDYEHAGDLEKALEIYTRLVNEDPHHIPYRQGLLFLEQRLGRPVTLSDTTPKNKK